jgi:hypothetical protein
MADLQQIQGHRARQQGCIAQFGRMLEQLPERRYTLAEKLPNSPSTGASSVLPLMKYLTAFIEKEHRDFIARGGSHRGDHRSHL